MLDRSLKGIHISKNTEENSDVARLASFGMNHFKIMMWCLVEPAEEALAKGFCAELSGSGVAIGWYSAYTWWLIIPINYSWD